MMNIELVCRTCLKEECEMKPIFSSIESEELLSNMISACSVTKVEINDGYPTKMCMKCIESVKISFDFKRQCESAYETLRNQLETQLAFDNSFKEAEKDTDSEDEFLTAKKPIEHFSTESLGPNEKIIQTEEICFHPCEMCEMKFMSEDMLRLHRVEHKEDGFKCRVCAKVYSRLTHLRRHIGANHPGIVISRALDDITCYVCNKLFTRTEHLKKHLATHGIDIKPPKIEKDGVNDETSKDSMSEVFLPSVLIQVSGAMDCKTEDEEQAQEDDEDEKPLISIRNKTDQSIADGETNAFASIGNSIVKTETISDEDDDGGRFDGDGAADDEDYDINKDIVTTTTKSGRKKTSFADGNYAENSSTSDDEYDETFQLNKSSKRKLRRGGGTGRSGKKKKLLGATVPKVKTSPTPKTNSVKERYPCVECKKVFVDPVKFEAHKLAHSQAVKIHQCEKCEKTFTRANHLKRHLVTHSDVKPFSCDICQKTFSRIDHLNIHMHHHSDIKPHVCDICEKGFTRAEHLRNHKASRHGDRPPSKKSEICAICQKGFTTPKYLAVHMRSHTDRIYACKFCDEKFGIKNDLNEHSKKHVHEKPFLCSECGLRFVRNDYLVIHMRRHKGEKPYKCKYCGKGFPRATDLTVHERYHTGEKTHLCTTCGKGFQRAYNLLVHMRVHTGERPYQCPHCVKSFAQGNDLKAHVRRHTGERYKCDICGDGFIQGYHLTQHKRNVHGIDMKSHIRRVEKFIPIPKPGAVAAAAAAVAALADMPDMQQLEQIEQLHRLQDEAKIREKQNLMIHPDTHHSKIVHVNDNGNVVKTIKMEPSLLHSCDTQISDSQSSHVTILSTMSSPRDQSHHSHMLDNSNGAGGHGQQQQSSSSVGDADNDNDNHMNMTPYNMSLNLITSAMHPKFKLPPTFQ